jgi:hypothetical protein
MVYKGAVDRSWLGNDVAKLEIVEQLRSAHRIKSGLSDLRIDDGQIAINFKGPGYTADTFIDRATGSYEITETRMGWGAVINDRVINVDGHPAYSRAIAELKSRGELGRHCRYRPSPYLNNIIRAGPSFYQEAHRGESRVPFGGGRSTDNCWLRGNARNTEGTNPMAS